MFRKHNTLYDELSPLKVFFDASYLSPSRPRWLREGDSLIIAEVNLNNNFQHGVHPDFLQSPCPCHRVSAGQCSLFRRSNSGCRADH